MNLPGIITITPDQPLLLERAARILGDSFIEEGWTSTWLSCLDEMGATRARKQEILHAQYLDELGNHVPYQGAYLLEDGTAAAGGYLYSELAGHTHPELQGASQKNFLAVATPQEREALAEQERRMEPISQFDWTRHREQEGDHIYFYMWAVDRTARGKGSLRRLINPFFDYADEHNLNCYLECYSDRLQSMYEHLGFELIDVLSDPAFDVTERRMVRRPGTPPLTASTETETRHEPPAPHPHRHRMRRRGRSTHRGHRRHRRQGVHRAGEGGPLGLVGGDRRPAELQRRPGRQPL